MLYEYLPQLNKVATNNIHPLTRDGTRTTRFQGGRERGRQFIILSHDKAEEEEAGRREEEAFVCRKSYAFIITQK